jgi:hypothetical protein
MTRKIRTTNAKVRSVAKPYEPAPGERLLMESHFARQAQTPAAPRLKVSDDSGATERGHRRIDAIDPSATSARNFCCDAQRHSCTSVW